MTLELLAIPQKETLRPVLLQPDYAAGEAEMSLIHAYNHEDARRKLRFHQDASRYLRSMGLYLGQHGFTLMLVRSNKGGIAVGGEVYATYVHPERQRQLDVVIESDIVADYSPRVDHVILHACWAERRLPEQEQKRAAEQQQGSAGESKPKRNSTGKQKAIVAYVHTRANGGPVCYLNPAYSSQVNAGCLLSVLEAEHPLQYWAWRHDGTLLSEDEAREEGRRLREISQQERLAHRQWQAVEADEAAEGMMLRENYVATMSSRLLFGEGSSAQTSMRGLAEPRLSRSGELTFLQRDFERDARGFLRALGSCLAAAGYGEMRLVEYDDKMVVIGEYRQSPAGVVLRVKLGPVMNTNVPQRHDHLVIAASTAPAGSTDGDEDEQSLAFDVPINLSASTYAKRVMARLGLPLRLAEAQAAAQDGSGQRKRTLRKKADVAGGSDLVQTTLFYQEFVEAGQAEL